MVKYTLSVYVCPEAYEKLEAIKSGISQKTGLSISRSKAVELLIMQAGEDTINKLVNTKERTDYYGKGL